MYLTGISGSIGRRTLTALVDRREFVSVLAWVITLDPYQLRRVPFPVPALDVQQQLEGVGDIGANGGVRQLHAGLENATGQAGDGLLRRVSMNCGDRSRGASIESLEQVESFAAADLTKDNAVRPMAKSRANQFSNGDGGKARLLASGLKSH